MVNFLTIKKFADDTGYTQAAINDKIDKGVWLQGHQWVKAPDGRRLISIEGYNQWVQSAITEALKQPPPQPSKSAFNTRVTNAVSASSSSPRPLI